MFDVFRGAIFATPASTTTHTTQTLAPALTARAEAPVKSNDVIGATGIRKSLRVGVLIFAMMPTAAVAQELADPAGSAVLVSAVEWLRGTLLGTVATVAAVIAVAVVGFMMLTGRINWRYGLTVILGCFILFGAASIVAGIRASAAIGG